MFIRPRCYFAFNLPIKKAIQKNQNLQRRSLLFLRTILTKTCCETLTIASSSIQLIGRKFSGPNITNAHSLQLQFCFTMI